MNISKNLAKKISNYDNPNSIGSRFRKRRSEILKNLIANNLKTASHITILDVGGRRSYWNIIPLEWLREKCVKITLLNIEASNEKLESDVFVQVRGDGRFLQFPDKTFDICHSNSVIEHVGDFEDMKLFAREIARVGQKYFVQTPSFYFPIEPHAMFPFFHWFPIWLRVRIIMSYSIGHWRKATNRKEALEIVKSAQLLKKSDLYKLFPDATRIYTERFIFPKSYIVVKE
ncbi:methyltransferase domain [Bellilinea caldifistulae]|uniref:Methyltransferase type 11 domain-containing protein n=1 Tax=Bellilinea caldifistulae TaxID=360411 RepID=A0A0P6X3R4_9CHLR|nr:class I SAM-dependent methyltransferase [Bellilinea caldifistulae]KPL77604.1 hypothetical protein AC812_03495 [Bellilinea caldifistulae]GAP09597.1 methyltransferase domain [Bellilinea caldifistulae]